MMQKVWDMKTAIAVNVLRADDVIIDLKRHKLILELNSLIFLAALLLLQVCFTDANSFFTFDSIH